MRSLIVGLLTAVLFFATPVLAQEQYDHNGSRVQLIWGDGDSMSVRYVRPRDGLPSIVKRGTLLFHGASPADGSIYGTAYIFSSKCRRAYPYDVTGSFTEYGFRLRGKAPQINSKCRVTGYANDNNSDLHFTAN